MMEIGFELAREVRCRCIRGSTAKATVWRYPRLACQESGPAGRKLLVEKGKATDHGAALVPGVGLAFARHNPTGPMEETNMS